YMVKMSACRGAPRTSIRHGTCAPPSAWLPLPAPLTMSASDRRGLSRLDLLGDWFEVAGRYHKRVRSARLARRRQVGASSRPSQEKTGPVSTFYTLHLVEGFTMAKKVIVMVEVDPDRGLTIPKFKVIPLGQLLATSVSSDPSQASTPSPQA